MRTFRFAASAVGSATWATGPAKNTPSPIRFSMKKKSSRAAATPSSLIWKNRMTAKINAAPAPGARLEKPRFALVIATAFGVGYIPKAPGTFGSLVGVATAFLSAVFFLRPASLGGLLSFHPNYDAVLMDKHFLVPGSDVHDAVLALPILCALALLLLLGAIGVWSASRAAAYSGTKDPQFVVVDEVAGQHLALLLPLIPIALPNLTAHMDFS